MTWLVVQACKHGHGYSTIPAEQQFQLTPVQRISWHDVQDGFQFKVAIFCQRALFYVNIPHFQEQLQILLVWIFNSRGSKGPFI